MQIRSTLRLAVAATLVVIAILPASATAADAIDGRLATAPRLRGVPTESFRIAAGDEIEVASRLYGREQIAPLVAVVGALPHGDELGALGLYVGSRDEVATICGVGTMACYDPVRETMTIDGEDEDIEGISRASVIAHEYGHHIANNRNGAIWSAFDAGTARWSTYEGVCERRWEGLAFPGDEGAHYWENPGEAFAQSYSMLVDPTDEWNYSPLFRPDPTALSLLREDVLDPVEPRESLWSAGIDLGTDRAGLATAMPVGTGTFVRKLAVPYDGRVRIRLRSPEGGRYRLALVDADTGKLLADAEPQPGGSTHLRYADCGHRRLEIEATTRAKAMPFEALVLAP